MIKEYKIGNMWNMDINMISSVEIDLFRMLDTTDNIDGVKLTTDKQVLDITVKKVKKHYELEIVNQASGEILSCNIYRKDLGNMGYNAIGEKLFYMLYCMATDEDFEIR